MKYLAVILLFICGQIVAQVPVILKSKNSEDFNVHFYEIKYKVTPEDSIKIKEFVHLDMEAEYIGNYSYYAKLELNTWYLILYSDKKGNLKNLFFQTDNLSVKSPMTITADFSNTKSCYVQYDPQKKTYVGQLFNLSH
jgi:hypothetical protein